jgi:glycosyltransferase involved in cell wall biosynthesis
MRIFYIADFILPTNRAYAIHVFKMLDGFYSHGYKSCLFIPFFDKKKLNKALDFFDLENKSSIQVERIFKKKIISNFIHRIFFGFKVAKKIKNFQEKNLVISRSLIASIFLSLFKVRHFLEIHQELKGLTKYLLINMNFINSSFIIKNIFISKSLANFYRKKTLKYEVLHDAVDTSKFKKKKIKKVKNISYVGSFYKGRGIDLIIKIANDLKNFNFFLYGKRNEKFKDIPKNIFLKNFVNQSKIPTILQNSDLLLLPYSKKIYISSDKKSSDISQFMSPLKLFESLASGTPIICSNIKVLREILKDNYNSILVKNFEDKNEWVSKIKKIQKNTKKLKFLSDNALATSKNYTWSKRTRIFLDLYK